MNETHLIMMNNNNNNKNNPSHGFPAWLQATISPKEIKISKAHTSYHLSSISCSELSETSDCSRGVLATGGCGSGDGGNGVGDGITHKGRKDREWIVV